MVRSYLIFSIVYVTHDLAHCFPASNKSTTSHFIMRMRSKSRDQYLEYMPGMSSGVVLVVLLLVCSSTLVVGTKKLQIGVKKRPETCDMKSKKGDRLSMHYTVR